MHEDDGSKLQVLFKVKHDYLELNMTQKLSDCLFSFENSLCKDYVTEKFFKVFEHDMVPIVFGHADYSKIAPPKSYIKVEDFKSIEVS